MIVPRRHICNTLQNKELCEHRNRRIVPDTSGIENSRPNIEHY